eukprot:TRINITY_DN11486_c0_g1_i3.p2 TRINITY_DN11486_c0_g1~~TRINITY_DN11486_c0_g1_i3.p2  ORF type:complete len:171 (+),score=7.10 TRINITY_DN11486_c0_g1_i3:284-796(+)
MNLAFLLAASFPTVQAVLIGAAVIPHGDFAYDCTLIGCQNGSRAIHEAATQVGLWAQRLQAAVVVITTPHGLASTQDYLWYLNHNGSGFALLGQDLHNGTAKEYKAYLSAQMDMDLSQQLLNVSHGWSLNNVSGLSSFADSEPVALRWGEVRENRCYRTLNYVSDFFVEI